MSGEHKAGENDEVELLQRAVEPLVVAGQAPKLTEAGKAAFNDPATGQEHETSLAFRI